MVSAGIEFKGGDVPEWYLTGELICPFAAEQLPETDVHHTMNNTFIVLGWVSFSHAGSFASLPFYGSGKQWKVSKNEEDHKVRICFNVIYYSPNRICPYQTKTDAPSLLRPRGR